MKNIIFYDDNYVDNAFLAVFTLIFLKLKKEDETGDVTRDWKFAAMVVDRLCLIIFTLFTIIATLAVLFSAPHFIVSNSENSGIFTL